MLVAERYRLAELLGRGGMGEVWRGQDEVLGRQVAVKLLLGDDGDESAAQRFRLEAQTAARLNHPQVVSVYDFGSWDGRFYLVMELVNGPSLAQQLSARGPLSPAGVAGIATQAASGLAAAHAQGVVHRDVKPGNLMLDANGTLKIGDFGIARFVDETSAGLTRVGQIVGTSTYLAPERALGRIAGPASDVYALGCVLYHLLVGQPPFWADSPTSLLYLHVDTPPVPPRQHRADVPHALDAYLLRMLAKEPEARPAAQEVADWFAGSSWRDTPQPLPPAMSPAAPPMAPAPVAAPVPTVVPAAAPPMPGTSPVPVVHRENVATYALPGSPATRSTPTVGGHRRSGSARGTGGMRAVRAIRPPRTLAGVIAGAVAFGVAAVIGAVLFTSDDDQGDHGRPDAQQSGTAHSGAVDPGSAQPTGKHPKGGRTQGDQDRPKPKKSGKPPGHGKHGRPDGNSGADDNGGSGDNGDNGDSGGDEGDD